MGARASGGRSTWLGAPAAAVLLTVSSGCAAPASPDAGDDVGRDAGPPRAEGLDLLFMIDDSGTMAEEQANLILELPRLVHALATGDADDDGVRELRPVGSLHVGIVTPDMGAGPNDGVPTCRRGNGDDGILQARSRLTSEPCMSSYPSGVFALAAAEGETDHATAVGCVMNLGTGGCQFEQQLDATLKALTPGAARDWTAEEGYVPPRFRTVEGRLDGEQGHGERANEGFLRPDSALAIVLVTDEDDCSTAEPALYVSGDPRFSSVPLLLRCHRFGAPELGFVYPVERYAAGFVGLRRDPRLFVLAALTGIPPEVEPAPGAEPEYEAILSNANMIPRETVMGTNLEPACSTTNGVAYPAIRIVEVARGVSERGGRVSLSSICTSSFRPAIDALLAQLARVFPPE